LLSYRIAAAWEGKFGGETIYSIRPV